MKKIISVTLALIMMLSLFVPQMNVFATDEEHPTIYIYGANTEELYLPDGTQVFPEPPIEIDIKELALPFLKGAATGTLTDDYSDIGKIVYDVVMPSAGTYAPDKNGEPSDGSAPKTTAYTQHIPVKHENYGALDYRMCYDWRLSPLVTAKELKDYIDLVLEATGDDKVNLMGRCYGANVVAAYLEVYKDHAIQYVDDVAYIAPAINGVGFVGALFSGDIHFDAETVNNFADYYLNHNDLIADATTKEFLLSFLELLEEIKALGITMDVVNSVVEDVKYDIIPPIMRDAYARMLSYWAMVPAEQVEDAIDFVFADCKEENAQFIEKILEYYNTVQLNLEKTTLELAESGIDFYIVAKYDLPDYPLFEGAESMSDGYIATYRQTFGGEYADCGKIFDADYIEANKDNKYLSPDYKINAESCLFPDTTWFIKNMAHDFFPDNLNDFTINLMNREETVSNGNISQFLTYENNEIVATEGTDEDSEEITFLDILKRFFTAIFNLIKNLTNK